MSEGTSGSPGGERSKWCSRCGCVKPIEAFHRNKGNKDGCNYWCRDCMSEYRIDRRREAAPISERPQDPGERWLPIGGYEGLYEVSNQGRVWSLARVDARGSAHGGRLLRCSSRGRGRGHPAGSLTDSEGVKRSFFVHQEVAKAFIGPSPFEGAVVRHLNDIPTDNRVENLAWGTRFENQQDAVRNGRNANANKKSCPRGHEFSEVNTISWDNPNGGITRICRACTNGGASHRRRKGEAWTVGQLADAWYRRHRDIGLRSRMSTAEMMERYG